MNHETGNHRRKTFPRCILSCADTFMKMSPTSTELLPKRPISFAKTPKATSAFPSRKQWQQLVELTARQPAALNAALKKLGSAIRLNEEEIPAGFGDFRPLPGRETASPGGQRVRNG